MKNTCAIPSIRSFQMDGSGCGIIKNSVNLFRGDINYSLNLLSLPGRSNSDGLAINLSIQYASNIHQAAMSSNLYEPTGILGLGWDMPLSMISLSASAPTQGASRYQLSVNGNDSPLIQEMSKPVLFAMNASLSSGLQNDEPISTEIRNEFLNMGLPISAAATVHTVTDGWQIQDAELEIDYLLKTENGELNAYDGGVSFQTINYNFSKIIYYPQFERWQITNAMGQVSSYGGGVIKNSQGKGSAGNSIEWGVLWRDAQGEALWMGNSVLTSAQQQYARSWRLFRSYSRFGEYVQYDYLPIQQAVGSNGLPYTKACYLHMITDVCMVAKRFLIMRKKNAMTPIVNMLILIKPYLTIRRMDFNPAMKPVI